MDVVLAIDSLSHRKEKLRQAFAHLERNQALLSKLGADWRDVEEYLIQAEARLRGAVAALGSKEKAFELRSREAKEALEKREAEVSMKERRSLTLIQEKKDEAVAIILERKRKWSEQQKSEGEEVEGKSKGEEEREEEGEEGEGEGEGEESKDKDVKGSGSYGLGIGENVSDGFGALGVDTIGLGDQTAQSGKRLSDITMSFNGVLASVAEVEEALPKPRPMLQSLCEAMDAEKLRLFISEHRKDFHAIGAELPSALRSAPDPARLVLNALEGYFYVPDQGSKKNDLFTSNKRACIILLEALANVLSSRSGPAEQPTVSEELKSSAKQIADFWRSKIDPDLELPSNQSIEVQSLLQLLATFGLAAEFDSDELCKLVLLISRRKQTPHLCRSLGLSLKAPDIIERLIKDGKQMEAISFAIEFELLDKFPPVSLLKSYLKDARKVMQNTQKGGYNATAAQNDANQKELSALKVVLRAIGDLKLEEKYPSAPLEKRLAYLEKAKADKKRGVGTGKGQQIKRPRTDAKVGGMAQHHNKPFYRPPEGRGPYGDPMLLPYNGATNHHPGFDRNHVGGYGSPYVVSSRNSAVLQNSYMYPSDSIAPLAYGQSSYTGNNTALPPYNSGYGGYGTGLPSAYQSYH